MHEFSIVQALLERAIREAQLRNAAAVHRLHLRIGELSGVEIPLLETAFSTFRQRTLCARAQLAIEPVAARWSCPRCGRLLARGEALRCPACELPGRLTQGDEIVLERIEMEVA